MLVWNEMSYNQIFRSTLAGKLREEYEPDIRFDNIYDYLVEHKRKYKPRETTYVVKYVLGGENRETGEG